MLFRSKLDRVSESVCERGEVSQGLYSESSIGRVSVVRMQRSGSGALGQCLPEPEGAGSIELAGGVPPALRGDAQRDQVPLIPLFSFRSFEIN